MNKIFAQLVEKRQLDDRFLNPRYEDLADPFLFPDMDKAVRRIEQAIDNREKVLIYGDYDVDGVTASTLMADALELAGVAPENLSIMLPNRFRDGYGMSPRLVERAKTNQINLVITVDCGSRNADIISELKAAGIDTIVTDHHECGEELPQDAIAVINPKRPDFLESAPEKPAESSRKSTKSSQKSPKFAQSPKKFTTSDALQAQKSGLRNLAGVGVAFKLAQALVKQGRIKPGQEKWLLDLVLLGTICDQMPLIGENHILGFYGLKVLAKTRRLGLKELIRTSGINQLTSDSIGFQLGPRLNAAGRMKSADLALNLLRATDRPTASKLAAELEELNKDRKNQQSEAVRTLTEQAPSSDPVLVATGPWHEGLIGIIAGRLTEYYHRPAFVLTEVEKNIYKGSGRSFGDFSLAEALENAKDLIIGGGGHAAAAGVKVAAQNLPLFTQKLNIFYKSLHLTDQEDYFKTHADLALDDFSDLTLDLFDEFAKLEPFGEGNLQPIFRLKGVRIDNIDFLGANRAHLRLDLSDRHRHKLKLISFYAPQDWLKITPDWRIEPLIHLEKNEFRGVTSVEGRLIDLNPIG